MARSARPTSKSYPGIKILRLGFPLLNHQTRIAPTTTMNRIVSFIGLPPFLNCENLALGMRYGKAQSSVLIIAGNLGHHALVFNEDDVVRLLRAAVEREGGQIAFAKRHGIDRALVNLILNGKRRVSGAIAKALGLRKVYVAVR